MSKILSPSYSFPRPPGWFESLRLLPITSDPVVSKSASQITTLLDRYTHLGHLTLLNSMGRPPPDRAFLRSIFSSGMLSDCISTLTVMAQGASLHNISASEVFEEIDGQGARL